MNVWTLLNLVFVILFWLTVDFDYLKARITYLEASVIDHETTLTLLLVFGLLHVVNFIAFRYFNEKTMGVFFQTKAMDAKYMSFASWFVGFVLARFMAAIGFLCVGVYWAGYHVDGSVLPVSDHFSKFTLFFAIANTVAFVLLVVKRKTFGNVVMMNPEMVNFQIMSAPPKTSRAPASCFVRQPTLRRFSTVLLPAPHPRPTPRVPCAHTHPCPTQACTAPGPLSRGSWATLPTRTHLRRPTPTPDLTTPSCRDPT
jgi:hypothetical protein